MTETSILYKLVTDTRSNQEVCVEPFLILAITLAGVVIFLCMLNSDIFDGGTPDFVNKWRTHKFKKLYLSGQIYHALVYADKHHVQIHTFVYHQDPKSKIADDELLTHLTNYLRCVYNQHRINWQLHTNLSKSWEKIAHHYCCITQRICTDHTFHKHFQYIRVQAVQEGKDVLDLLNELQNYKEE